MYSGGYWNNCRPLNSPLEHVYFGLATLRDVEPGKGDDSETGELANCTGPCFLYIGSRPETCDRIISLLIASVQLDQSTMLQ